MNLPSFTKFAVAAGTAGVLAACSGGGMQPASYPPGSAGYSQHRANAPGLRFRPLSNAEVAPATAADVGIEGLRLNAPAPLKRRKAKNETYATEFQAPGGDSIYGYPNLNPNNYPPNCTIQSQNGYSLIINGTAGDPKGNFIAPGNYGGTYFTTNVYKAKTCGTLLGAPADMTGQPAAAASLDAASGTIVVGEIIDYTIGTGNTDGAVLVCSISAGCGAPLTNSAVGGFGAGVTTDKSGDCWFSTYNTSKQAILIYWQSCAGSGQVTTGYSSAAYGGLFTDTHGNIGQITFAGTLDIYKGCNPACTLISSTTLPGKSLFGNLNHAGDTLVVGDYANATCDVFKYSPTGSTYEYSFNNGLDPYSMVESCVEAKTNKP